MIAMESSAMTRRQVRDLGTEEVLPTPRSPWQRADVERVIGSIRRECLDHIIVFNEVSLRRSLRLYFDYYHGSRTTDRERTFRWRRTRRSRGRLRSEVTFVEVQMEFR